MIDFDKILDDLENSRNRARDIALTKAHALIETINKEHEAYLDGIYDAVKVIKSRYEKEQKDGKQKDN